MAPPIKDFRMTVKIANNQIRERREALGLSVRQASIAAGMGCHTTWYGLESMRMPPTVGVYYSRKTERTRIGEKWSTAARKIAKFFKVEPSDLWPDAVRAIRQTKIELRVNAEQIAALASAGVAPPGAILENEEMRSAVALAMAQLNPRDAEVLRLRFGFDGGGSRTYEEVGEQIGLSRERVRQRESRGLKSIAKIAQKGHPVGEVYQP